jgi:hypothetical protein
MIRHVFVEIRRNEGATISNSFPEWEVPILRVVHGDDAVKEIGDRLVNRDLPDAQDEFVRLNDRYKRSRADDGSQSTPFVHMVYGQFPQQKLAQAIQDAYREAPTAGDLVGDTGDEGIAEVPKAAAAAPHRTRRARGQNSSVGG